MTNQPKPPGETPLELKRYIALRAHTVARWGRSMPHGAKRREDEMSEKPDAPMSEEERADRLERMVDTLAGTVVDLKAENAALVAECDMALAVTVERDGLSGRLTNALARIQALEPLITENAALREAAANLVAGAIFNQTGVVITNAALYALRAALRPRTHGAMASECQEWREMLEKAARRDMMDAKEVLEQYEMGAGGGTGRLYRKNGVGFEHATREETRLWNALSDTITAKTALESRVAESTEARIKDNERLHGHLGLLEKAIRHALNGDAGWDLYARAILDPHNRDAALRSAAEVTP